MLKRKRKNNSRNLGFNIVFVILAYVLTVVCVASSAYVQNGYTIAVNSVSPKSFVATREVIDEIETERRRTAAADAVVARYAQDPTINEEIMQKLDNFFDEISDFRVKYMPIINPTDGIERPGEPISSMDKTSLVVQLDDEQFTHLIQMVSSNYEILKEESAKITGSALETGIKENDGIAKSIAEVRERFNQMNWDNIQKTIGFEIAKEMLRANEFVDEIQTNKIKEEKANEVEPKIYLEGQNIITQGDIVTPEIYAVLDTLGFVNKGALTNLLPLVGSLSIATIVFLLSIFYAFQFHREILVIKKRALLLFTLYAAAMLLIRGLMLVPFPLVPLLLFVLLISLLIDTQLAIVLCCTLTVNTVIVCNADIKYLFYFISSGILVSVVAKYTTERSKAFSIGLVVSLVQAAIVAAIFLFFEKRYSQEMLNMVVYASLAGVLTVILCIGSLPIWEAIFGVVTPIKLLELTNPNKTLLRRLIIEAPGTYHHSLLVANLAETAAFDIGANHILARVGGYYHDIGKLKYPQYFAENQVGENLHDFMDPYSSAQVIIGHVAQGVELANQAKLPETVTAFIEEHHGDTLVKYFYFKAKKEIGEHEVDESEFRYKGPKPRSRETAIVMLADTVEAAVRSMIPSGKTMLEVEEFVKMLIKDKLDDGQLDESGLKISDLTIAARAFMRVFRGMYHERVPYPKESTKALTETTSEPASESESAIDIDTEETPSEVETETDDKKE